MKLATTWLPETSNARYNLAGHQLKGRPRLAIAFWHKFPETMKRFELAFHNPYPSILKYLFEGEIYDELFVFNRLISHR